MHVIIKEIEKRKNKVEISPIIGTEIKRRRLDLSMTLDSCSGGLCSVSYLSKLENSKAETNPMFVREICKNVQMSDETIKSLLQSDKLLKDAVTAFLMEDKKKLRSLFKSVSELDNYRIKIIRFIYYCFSHDMRRATKEYEGLIVTISTMSDSDLIVFTLFAGIYHYLNFSFDDAIEELYILRELTVSLDIKELRDKYIFLANLALNKPDTKPEYDVISDLLLKNGQFDLLDEINYALCIYYAKNNSNHALDNTMRLLKNETYKASVGFLRAFLRGNEAQMKSYKDSDLNDFGYAILGIKNNNPKMKAYAKGTINTYYQYDSFPEIIKYVATEEILDKIKFITKKVFPRLLKTKEKFLIEYFFNELAYLCLNMGKYKIFSEWYVKFYDLR